MADSSTEDTVYDLGIMRWNDIEIECGKFKVGYKIKNERQTVTNKTTGVGWSSSEEEYTFEASDILPKYKEILKDRWKEQKKDKHGLTISTYNFLEDGEYQEQDVLLSCMIESVDMEQDGGNSVTVKGEALTLK